MTIRDDIWAWIQTAPLPVVLAISLTGFGVLGSWAWGIDADAAKAKTDAAVAAEQAKNAKDNTDKLDGKMDKINDKLDRLLEAVAALKQEQKDKAKAKQP